MKGLAGSYIAAQRRSHTLVRAGSFQEFVQCGPYQNSLDCSVSPGPTLILKCCVSPSRIPCVSRRICATALAFPSASERGIRAAERLRGCCSSPWGRTCMRGLFIVHHVQFLARHITYVIMYRHCASARCISDIVI